ncbi:MAG: N-acetylglucosamine-6-phosphate deacetylase [Prolixibacteraceae bacterium]
MSGSLENSPANCFSVTALHYETMLPVQIEIADGKILAINDLGKGASGAKLPIVAPGLIDNQVNGYSGVDFSGDDLTVEGIVKATRSLWKTGVTTYLPTLITNSPTNLIRNFRVLVDALAIKEVGLSVPGFHLEGPYLSGEDGFRGCHPLQFIAVPDVEQLMNFQQAARGKIAQITLAPELPGSGELIRYCKSNGIVVAIGHSNANSREIQEACNLGARLSTHLGNGCANQIHRHNNPIWPQLANDLLIPTLIADGHHLTPDELKVFLKVKGPGKIILTSDITYLAGMPAGRYSFGGADVLLSDDGMLRSADQDCLAGATMPLLKGVVNMMNFTGCSLSDAINMASKNVAEIFGWNDRGQLLPGKRADLILLEWDDKELISKKLIVAGEIKMPYQSMP